MCFAECKGITTIFENLKNNDIQMSSLKISRIIHSNHDTLADNLVLARQFIMITAFRFYRDAGKFSYRGGPGG